MKAAHYWHCFVGIQTREWLRFWQQRTRFASALVRPLLWLVVFAAGFRAVLGISIIPPYETYITYETYIAPGLCGMIILFNSMQSALSMVYDRELGSMRVLLMSPLPRPFLLVTKLLAMGVVSIGQVYVFLLLALLVDVEPPLWGYLAVLPALILTSLMLGALGLLIATWIKPLAVLDLPVQPVYPRGGGDPVFPVSGVESDGLWDYRRCDCFPGVFCHSRLSSATHENTGREARIMPES